MRKVDDLIVSTINTVIPTDSFHPNGEKACKELHEQLEDGNVKRESTIKKCIAVTTERVKQLKEQRETDNANPQISKSLRSEQTKVRFVFLNVSFVLPVVCFQLRMLQVELSVEELIRQRTSKVFMEKCRRYFKPQ